MPETFLQNSLVSYKRKPARVIAVVDKLEIMLDDGQTCRVRPKDVFLIHPGPVHDVGDLATRIGEDVKTVCELVAGSPITLGELAELLYGDESPSSRWNAWQLVSDGIYFYGVPENIQARAPEKAEEELAKREARARKARAWTDFLQRVRTSGPFRPEDADYLKEIEELAFDRTGQSRLLRKLGIEQTPANAHALLLKLGHWHDRTNPHPIRIGLDTNAPQLPIPALAGALSTGNRRDLTHLRAFAIDDEGNQDPDDAISLDGARLWIHVADVAFAVTPDSAVDLEARGRGATLYLPELTAPMLPEAVVEELGLGKKATSPALSFGLDLDADGAVSHLEIVPSLVRVERLTYAAVEERMGEAPFCHLWWIAQTARARRRVAGAIFITLPDVAVRVVDGKVHIRVLPELNSRILVGEIMIMAGEAVARFALERDIPFPFIAQAGVNLPLEHQRQPETLAEMYGYRRKLAPRQMSTTPGPHGGLGVGCYSQVTSPLRRYLDLVAHQQLRAWLQGDGVLGSEKIIQRIGATQAATAGTRKGERLSNRHWTLVYLREHSDWQGEGILVEKGEKRGTVLIPSLGLDAQVRYRGNPEPGQVFRLALGEVDLPQLSAYFAVEKSVP
uniref:Exoribonuclease-2 n=1 Tax=Candidatus Kentrum eta TaxID=2126337 RepID=A0A450VFA4_9GAMM|nr:MAG: exoribonuclease-2 [Candidatus Kentron sp. H]VFJ98360.1 MAG: exoribonuclease-2 [Candidatus Kentron sp. H]VFK03476.1 MAG: exoribonuclease-2 [Candidatus Kentron sp. H]